MAQMLCQDRTSGDPGSIPPLPRFWRSPWNQLLAWELRRPDAVTRALSMIGPPNRGFDDTSTASFATLSSAQTAEWSKTRCLCPHRWRAGPRGGGARAGSESRAGESRERGARRTEADERPDRRRVEPCAGPSGGGPWVAASRTHANSSRGGSEQGSPSQNMTITIYSEESGDVCV